MTKSTLIERTRTVAARCLWRLVRLCPAVRELEADNDRIRKDFGDMSANRVTLYDIAVRNGRLTAELGTEAAWLIAEKFGMLLRESGAEKLPRNAIQLAQSAWGNAVPDAQMGGR